MKTPVADHIAMDHSTRVDTFVRTTANLLPILRDTNGAIYGSWAMKLQACLVARAPSDLDVEMVIPSMAYSAAIDGLASCPGLILLRHEPVRFTQTGTAKPVVGRALVSARHGDGDSTPIVVGFKLIREQVYPRFSATLTSDRDEFRVPVLAIEACIAQKVARISLTRSRGKRHTRWQDAIDLYDVLGDDKFVESHGGRIADSIVLEWHLRGQGGTPKLLPPPLEWADAWDAACFLDGVRRPPPVEAIHAINAVILGLFK